MFVGIILNFVVHDLHILITLYIQKSQDKVLNVLASWEIYARKPVNIIYFFFCVDHRKERSFYPRLLIVVTIVIENAYILAIVCN